MEWTQFVLPAFVAIEILIILVLYRYVLRDWIIEKWEEKLDEEGWLIIKLEPVIDEIEERMHEKLEAFQASFFGSLGAASKKVDEATGQTTIKAITKDNPILGFVADYMMKRGNLGALQALQSDKTPPTQPKQSLKIGQK